MPATVEVDLCGITWPVCLLKFKTALNELCPCDVLEVLIQDPDVVKQISMIVDRSESRLIDHQNQGDLYRLSVEKGEGPAI